MNLMLMKIISRIQILSNIHHYFIHALSYLELVRNCLETVSIVNEHTSDNFLLFIKCNITFNIWISYLAHTRLKRNHAGLPVHSQQEVLMADDLTANHSSTKKVKRGISVISHEPPPLIGKYKHYLYYCI